MSNFTSQFIKPAISNNDNMMDAAGNSTWSFDLNRGSKAVLWREINNWVSSNKLLCDWGFLGAGKDSLIPYCQVVFETHIWCVCTLLISSCVCMCAIDRWKERNRMKRMKKRKEAFVFISVCYAMEAQWALWYIDQSLRHIVSNSGQWCSAVGSHCTHTHWAGHC